MTTLRNLYEFLGLNLSHYSSWCKRNIVNNPFATEGIDYFVVRIESESKKYNPNHTTDYKLTSDFAKQLSMTVKNERGQEARKYFIACEQGFKKNSSLNVEIKNVKYKQRKDKKYINNIMAIQKLETVTSMEVAEMVNKEHKYLMRDIRRYTKQLNEGTIAPVDFWIETTYLDAKGEKRPCFNVTCKGREFIANKLTGQKGTEFTARYVNKFHELEEGNITNSFITALNTISESMAAICNSQNDINNRLSKLEEQSNKKKLPEKKYSRWKTSTFRKLNNLLSYVNENSDENLKLSEIIHLVTGKTEDTYSIKLNDYTDAYKSEFDLDTTSYAIDVINRYKDIRDMFTLTLDSIMEKLHIAEDTDCNGNHKTRNIFDELATKVERKH